MINRRRRGVSGFLLSPLLLSLLLAAALALAASGCRGPRTAAPPGQGAQLAARSEDERTATDPAPLAGPVEPTASVEPTSTPEPTADPPPTSTPTVHPTATPVPATRPPSTPASESSAGPVIGQAAPPLTLPDLAGNLVTLSDLRGKPVLLNFWATW
jgi:hypothetical protein